MLKIMTGSPQPGSSIEELQTLQNYVGTMASHAFRVIARLNFLNQRPATD